MGPRCASGEGTRLPACYEVLLTRAGLSARNGRGTVCIILEGNRRWAREAWFTDLSEGHACWRPRKIADLLWRSAIPAVPGGHHVAAVPDKEPHRQTASLSNGCWKSSPTWCRRTWPRRARRGRLRIVGRAAWSVLPVETASRLVLGRGQDLQYRGRAWSSQSRRLTRPAGDRGTRPQAAAAARRAGTTTRNSRKCCTVDHNRGVHLYTSVNTHPIGDPHIGG